MSPVIKRYPPLSPEEREEVLALRRAGYTWHTLRLKVGISLYRILFEFDRAELERQRARLANYRKNYRPDWYRKNRAYKTHTRPEPRALAPDHIIEERNRVYDAPETLGILLLGEPRPGRSALDRRQEAPATRPHIGASYSRENTLMLFTKMRART